MKTMLKIFLLLFGFFLISCSDDPIKEPSTDENGGIISRYQMVRINMESTPLSQDIYDGTFNNKSIKLSKVDDHELVFYVHETTPLGEKLLSIPALAEKKILYEVKDVILTQSVQETIQPLMTDFQEFSTTLTSDPVDLPFVQNHNAMMTYYNGLTDAEKAEVAKFYKVNKDIIDAIYNTDYSAIQGKASSADFDFPHYRKLVNCYKASLAVEIIGAAVAVAEPSKLISPIALGVALGGAKSAIDFHHQIQTEVYTVIEVNVNGWFGDNNKQSNTLTFNDNQTMTFPFSLNNRNIVNSDASSSKEFMALFFATKNGVNNLIDNINIGLTSVNNNVTFISFSKIPNVSVSATSSGVLKNVNTAAMQRISFSVNHPNLSLENATLSGTGQLSLKIKIVGTPSSTPISSTLNYSYSDDFSSFSGSFPINVNLDTSTFLIGSWLLKEYDGYLADQYYSIQDCPPNPTPTSTYSRFKLFGTTTFTANTYNCNVGRAQDYNYCLTNVCASAQLCHVNPNSYAHNGTYESNGNYQFTIITNNAGSLNSTITVVDQNNIIVTEDGVTKKYQRQ